MKKKINEFFDKYITWAFAILGIPLTFYGAWFQTEGFTLPEAPFFDCLIAMLFGGILGAALMSYLLTVTKKDVVGKKKLIRKELGGLIRGNFICFILCLILVYFAQTVLFFKIGLGAMTFLYVTAWYYKIWELVENAKKKKAEHADVKGTPAK